MSAELSPSAQKLLNLFKRQNRITTEKRFTYEYPWIAYRYNPEKSCNNSVRGNFELEAVRALCKEIGLLCPL